MPIYEYNCKDCNENFEKIVLNNSAKVICPKCGSENLNKKYSVFGFKSAGGDGESKFISSSAGGCSGCRLTSCSTCGK